jgi:GNAT superfamily N-acetyltransferase
VETPIRRASASDSEAIADLYLTAREAASPYVPMPAHTDGEVRDWISNLVVPTLDVWLAEGENGVVGLLVIDRDWIDQLYVEPSLPTRGIGRNLLDFAKSERPTGLRLWTFDSNRGGRRFYERHGFEARGRTDGANEERAPDVLYVWDGSHDR